MFKDLLPIGSVVILRGGVRKLMIIGIKGMVKNESDKIYDYIGVLYPEGFLGDDGIFLFNQSDVNDIIFEGYKNPERSDFLAFLEDTYTQEELEEQSEETES